MNNQIIAVVPAAGIGSRAQTTGNLPKQYRNIGTMPMLRHTVMALLREPRISQVRVIVAADDAMVADALDGLPRTTWRFCGGASRSDTVRNALVDADLSDDTWVMVHDAARPGLPVSALARLIDSCLQHDNGGILALPVVDTVKLAAGASVAHVARTLPRDGLWLAQTPQMFRAGVLLAALRACIGRADVTDEASALELSGVIEQPLLVLGARENMKLTYSDDFVFFERFLLPNK